MSIQERRKSILYLFKPNQVQLKNLHYKDLTPLMVLLFVFSVLEHIDSHVTQKSEFNTLLPAYLEKPLHTTSEVYRAVLPHKVTLLKGGET